MSYFILVVEGESTALVPAQYVTAMRQAKPPPELSTEPSFSERRVVPKSDSPCDACDSASFKKPEENQAD